MGYQLQKKDFFSSLRTPLSCNKGFSNRFNPLTHLPDKYEHLYFTDSDDKAQKFKLDMKQMQCLSLTFWFYL